MRLIDADALKEHIKNQAGICRLLNNDAMREYANIMEFGFCKEIDNTPTIAPQPQWIPCSERLPKYGQPVLTYNLKDDEYELNHIIDEEDGEWFTHGVDAWMPLPKSYKENKL